MELAASAFSSKSAKVLVDRPKTSPEPDRSDRRPTKAKTANLGDATTSKDPHFAESKHFKIYCIKLEVEICKCATFWVIWLAIATTLLYFQITATNDGAT